MVHEHVAACSTRKKSAASVAAGEHRLGLRHPRLVLELGPVERVQRPEAGEVERAVDDGDVAVGELELAAEQLEHLVGHRRVDLEAHDAAEASCAGAARLDRLEEVFGLVFELEVGVAGDAERIVRDDVHPGEQPRRGGPR